MTLAQARRFALSLPEVTEEPHFDKQSFRVNRKIFATVPPGGEHLHVFVEERAARVAVRDDPRAFELLRWGVRLVGVRVTLCAADGASVSELLEASWRRRAPKRLIARV